MSKHFCRSNLMKFSLDDLLPFLPSAYTNRQPNFLRFALGDRGVALLFRTGSVVVTGIRSPNEQKQCVTKCVALLTDAFGQRFHNTVGIDILRVRVKTILATGKLDKVRICPYDLYKRAPFPVRWEPEITNAIIVSFDNVTLKLFPSTSSVVMFGKNFDHMVSAFILVRKFVHIHYRL
jgi:TATA-box binding protein (TBP) (component of TFIID and TFIIIB)